MWTAKELVTWAASQIGTKESPAGSNHIWYWDFYKEHCGVNYQGSPWCAAFVTTGLTKAGVWNFTKDEGRFRYCPSVVNWAKQNGLWRDRSEKPQPGWLILFANEGTACHIGFVEKRIDSSKVQTIEGNTSVSSNDNGGSVMRRTRKYGSVGSSWYILGFVAIDYAKEVNVKAGWVKDSKGWWYRNADGTWPKSSWKKISGKWYWFDANGYAVHDRWLKLSGIWYYFDSSCAALQSTCAQIKGKWYAFDADCHMKTSVKVSANGDLIL